MAAIGDVYQVQVEGVFSGQQWITTYYYEQRTLFVTTDPTASQTVAERFFAQVLPSQTDLAPAEVSFDRIAVKNLFDPADAFTLVVGLTGGLSAVNQYQGTYSAYAFELQGESTITRRGAKRLPGVIEAFVDDGIVTDVGFIGDMQAYADACASFLTVGAIIPDNVFAPVIVKRVRSGTAGNYFYRLPETLAESVTNTILDVLVDLLVTTQTSRKIGVGS